MSATELHVTWDDDTIEAVLEALTRYAGVLAGPARDRVLQARADIEQAEVRAARAGVPELSTEILREPRDGYVEAWHTEPPAHGVRYRVHPGGDEWATEDGVPVRHIYRIEVST